jgi:MSHA biogenesis protein MshK
MSAMVLAGVLSLAASGATRAAEPQPVLIDPTRPPNVRPAAERGEGGAAAAPRLHSILISPQRRMAVIDGRTVPLGGKVDEATLVQVSETQVTLREGGKLKVLELYPGITVVVPDRSPANKKKGTP